MVPLTGLWLSILLSAAVVFVASFIMHMVLPYHCRDYKQLPDEDQLLAALRSAGVKRGLYMYLAVLRVAGTAAFLAYGVGQLSNGIWAGQPWSLTIKHVMDGLVYSVLVGAVFSWLWPH